MSNSRPSVSVVVSARNEAQRIGDCLAAIAELGAEEVLVVDGGSTDDTVAIAESMGVRVIRSGGRGLAYDRQLGADAATCDLIAMIDADHRPEPDLIEALWQDMQRFDFAVIQAGVAIAPTSFWTRAEGQAMETFHHQPGPRSMIGAAPALYRRSVFQRIRFDTVNPEVSDDADFFYRMTLIPDLRFGIAACRVTQVHFPAFSDYVEKFRWYGRMDAAFCTKHPERASNTIFHLVVRYPILRPIKAILTGRFLAPFWFWLAAVVRLGTLIEVRVRERGAGPRQA